MIIKVHHKHSGRRVAEAIAAFDPEATFRGEANTYGAVIEAQTKLTEAQVRTLLGVDMVYQGEGEFMDADKFGLPF